MRASFSGAGDWADASAACDFCSRRREPGCGAEAGGQFGCGGCSERLLLRHQLLILGRLLGVLRSGACGERRSFWLGWFRRSWCCGYAGCAGCGPKIMVPAGTHIPLVLHNAISTRSARPGDPVYFETLFPVMIDGKVVIPAGSYVSGEVTESKRPGRVKGRGELMIKLTTMILPNAYMVNLNAVPGDAGTGGNETTDSEGKIIGDSEKGHDIGTIAKTTAAGAGIGGVASQSGAGVGIGAAAGAAVGLAAVLLTRGPDAEMPRGSTVEAVIDRSLYLDADKVQFSGAGTGLVASWACRIANRCGIKILFKFVIANSGSGSAAIRLRCACSWDFAVGEA